MKRIQEDFVVNLGKNKGWLALEREKYEVFI
jgi:hypothetical protein